MPLSSYGYSMYIYATVVGGEVGEREALSSFKLKLLTLDRRARGANDKARAINGPGHDGPISFFPQLSMLAWRVSGAQTCFFVSGDKALICWTAFWLVLHAKADQTIAAALQPPLT